MESPTAFLPPNNVLVMDRDKLIERARKLFAMSRDASSPPEAAIADRRLKVLMDEHRITLEEIKGSEQDSSSPIERDGPVRSPVRRKRTRSSGRQNKKRFSVRRSHLFATIAVCGIGVALSLWVAYSGVDDTSDRIVEILNTHRSAKSSQSGTPSLTASVERASVIEGESIVLYINGSSLSRPPNTSSLESNFSVIGIQANQSADTQDFQIRMVLQPRQTGVLFIPSFFADGVQSEQIVLDVVPRN